MANVSSSNGLEKYPKLRFKGFSEPWHEIAIGDLFKVTRGYVLPSTAVKEEPQDGFVFPVFSSQTKNEGLMGYYNEYLYEDAITWTTDGANAGTVHYRDGKFYCTNVCGVLLNEDGNANRCVAEILGSVSKKYVSYVGNPKLMNNVMSEIRIHIPSLLEQKKIDSFIASLDHRIAKQRELIEHLKKYKRGVISKLLSRSLDFSNSASIDWVSHRVGDFCTVQMCKRIFKEQTSTEGDVPFYKIGTIGGEPDAYISREVYEEYRQKYNFPRKGEFLISCAGTVGKCVVYNGEDSYYQDSNIVWLRNESEFVLNEYLYLLVSNVDWSTLNSTTITRIYNDNLRDLVFDFPPIEVQKKISEFCVALDKRVEGEAYNLSKLLTFKQGLIQGLFA